MSSLFWYNCLAIIGVGIAVYSLYMKRYTYKISTLVVFYLFATSITWIGEYVALGIFNGYAYKPGVFADPWAENITGHLLLNSTIWPGAATLMVAYSLGYGWFPLITAPFILAEYLFAKLGIYEQHWWKYYMSVIVVVLFLTISRKWFVQMNHTRYGLTRAVIFYFIGLLIIHTPVPLLLLFGKQYYSLGLVENMFGNLYRSSTIFIFAYHLIESFLLVFFVCIFNKWLWKLVPFIIAFVGQSTLAKMNILIFQDGWQLLYTNLIYAICLIVFILIERYTLRPPEQYYKQ